MDKPIPEAVRDAFEAWAKSQGRSTNTWAETGEYTHYDTQRCWEAWQAALTAAQQQGQAVAVVGPGGYPNWLLSWLESEAYRTLPQGTKLYTAPPSAPVGVSDALLERAWKAAAAACVSVRGGKHTYVAPVSPSDWYAALRPALETALAQQPAAVDGSALREVVDYLCGIGELEGRNFGDAPPRDLAGRQTPYWWREHLRRAAAPHIATQHQEPTT